MMKSLGVAMFVLLMGMCGAGSLGQSLFAKTAAPRDLKISILVVADGKEAKAAENKLSTESMQVVANSTSLSSWRLASMDSASMGCVAAATNRKRALSVEKMVDDFVVCMDEIYTLENDEQKSQKSVEKLRMLEVKRNLLRYKLLVGLGSKALGPVIIKKFKQGIGMMGFLSGYDFRALNTLSRDTREWKDAVNAFNEVVEKARDAKVRLLRLLPLIGGIVGKEGVLEYILYDELPMLLSKYVATSFYESAGSIDAALAIKQEDALWTELTKHVEKILGLGRQASA